MLGNLEHLRLLGTYLSNRTYRVRSKEPVLIDYRNPYTPGTETMPKYLAGRKLLLESARLSIKLIADGYQARPIAYYGMIAALHRCSRLNLPVIVFCAGLPKLLKSMSEAKTYSERLFEFVKVGSLSNDAARKAIEEPAGRGGG